MIPQGTFSRNRGTARLLALTLIFYILFGAVVAYYVVMSTIPPSQCDDQLSDSIGAKGFCLKPLSVVLSSSNTSIVYVPVFIMKSASNATMTILYHNVVTGGQQFPGATSQPRLPPLSTNSTPYALSLASGSVNITAVRFSQGTRLFDNDSWSIYQYQVSASRDSEGYYALLPPFYVGFYPALYVENSTAILNSSSFDMWGYQGIIMTLEFVLPSVVVGVSNMNVLNVTVDATYSCPNTACTLITHSGY